MIVTDEVRVNCQRYLLATLDDTNKVERFGTLVRRICHFWTCRVFTRHLFPSNSPARPGILLKSGCYYATAPIASPANELRLNKIIQNTIS